MSKNNFWLAAHLYYGGPRELFLAEAVHPFVEKVLAAGLAEQFFFIRYGERGPHIRLRFRGAEKMLTQVVQPQLDAFFSRFFERRPSARQESHQQATLPINQQWLPNNTIHYAPYEPEVERYGGPIGIRIAERQFQLSSETVLTLLVSSQGWNYERALGVAIQMHLGLAWAMGMTLAETQYFFSRVYASWLAMAYSFAPHSSAEKVDHLQQVALAAFAENFERQQEQLAAFLRQFWQALTDGLEFEQEWLNDWLRGMQRIGEALQRADLRDQLAYSTGLKHEPMIPLPPKRQYLWSILASYVHMTNNRLGILNRDEAFLGYLIVRGLETVETSY